MLTARVIPCLDVKDGRVVKGIRFRCLRDAGCPVERAAAYEIQGADEIVLLDVAATPAQRSTQLDVVRQVRQAIAIPLTVGGGVSSVSQAGALLEAGADKVAVNSAAVATPDLLAGIASEFGCQCCILALDAARNGAGGWQVRVRSGREDSGLPALPWAARAVALGAGEILLTSFDRDGTRSGYDLDLIAAVRNEVEVPIIASGGAASPAHMLAALLAGADAALAATIFHDHEFTVAQVKHALASGGVAVRP